MIADLIYDVGMNNGDDTAYYLSRGFRVVAIEANQVLAEQVSKRFDREIVAGKLTILNVGVADTEGTLPFWICDEKSEWSSFDRAIASRDGMAHHQISIPCRTFRSILAEFGTPQYLKLDIEEAEMCCLRGLGTDLPKYVSFERSAPPVDSLTLMSNLGYTGFKLISQYNLIPVEYPPCQEQRTCERAQRLLEIRNPLVRLVRKVTVKQRLLRQVNRFRYQNGWTFPMGSSGPFGDDLPGKWQNCDEMLETVARADAAQAAGESSIFWGEQGYSFWSDFHARRQD